MAFIVFSIRGEELGRRALDGPLVIGRAPDCDVRIRDIRLSRHHCRLEPTRGGWTVVDLGSRNGTLVDGKPVARRGLRDGDVLMAGNVVIRFHLGKMAPARPPARDPSLGRGGVNRPLDPHEALAGTVSGFSFDAEYAEEFRREHNLPIPQPAPPEPPSYAKEDVYGMLTEIASSSWDSIYAGASRPLPRFSESGAPPAPLPRTRVRAEAFDPRLEAPSPARPKRPALPPPVGRPSRVRSVLRAVARPLVAMHRWVAPRGSYLIF